VERSSGGKYKQKEKEKIEKLREMCRRIENRRAHFGGRVRVD
jgi:hypothetical protein